MDQPSAGLRVLADKLTFILPGSVLIVVKGEPNNSINIKSAWKSKIRKEESAGG